jgi:hypothetical protein
MLTVSEIASEELKKAISSRQAKANNLVIYFQGMG